MKHILIVAGGKGLRMGSDIPKQFIPVGGRPVLMHTLDAFYRHDPTIDIILVLPQSQQSYWKELCAKYDFHIPHRIANGGETRFHSVKNGLELIEDRNGLTGIHDGVRPFVSSEVIVRCYTEAAIHKAVIPVVDVIETLRHLNRTVPRNEYKLVQTPQVFDTALLQQAYQQPYKPDFTDDASVVEALGQSVFCVEGNRENIKITTPYDLTIANALIHV